MKFERYVSFFDVKQLVKRGNSDYIVPLRVYGGFTKVLFWRCVAGYIHSQANSWHHYAGKFHILFLGPVFRAETSLIVF